MSYAVHFWQSVLVVVTWSSTSTTYSLFPIYAGDGEEGRGLSSVRRNRPAGAATRFRFPLACDPFTCLNRQPASVVFALGTIHRS